jgi:hypothetical protein
LLRLVLLLAVTAPARAGEDADLQSLDRDDAAAEAALARGDVQGALKYFDYFGHEQEDFARATLEHRLARQKLRDAVREAFGRRAWARAAAALGVGHHWRGDDAAARTVRRDGDVLYVKLAGGDHEIPYVKVDGVWKLSIRDVLATAVKARFGRAVEYEEADLYVLAGKMARVLRERAGQLAALADDVKSKRVKNTDELHAAVERIRPAARNTR